MGSSKTGQIPPSIFKNGEVDIISLLKGIWSQRRFIWLTIGLFFIFGLVIAFASPIKFRATAVLLPHNESRTNLDQLGGLASLAGINLSSIFGEPSGIKPDLYPKIVSSFPFLKELADVEYIFIEEIDPISLYEKRMKDSTQSVISVILKYTVGLPAMLKKTPDSEVSKRQEVQKGVVFLSKREQAFYADFLKSLSVDYDTKTGLVTLNVLEEEPYLSAQIANSAVNLLQEYIIRYQTGFIQSNLDFIEERYEEKKSEFEQAQRALFAYRDMYRNQVAERVDSRYQELIDSYNLSQSVYMGLAQQLEQTRIAVKKESLAFSIVEPVKVPVRKSYPRRSLVMIIFLFMGGFVGVGLAVCRLFYFSIRRRFLSKEESLV